VLLAELCRPLFDSFSLVAWYHSFCFFYYFLVHTFIPPHSYSTFRRHSPRFLSISSISSSLVSSVGKTSLGCRAVNLTRACHTSSGRTNNWATLHHTELSRTFTKLRRTILILIQRKRCLWKEIRHLFKLTCFFVQVALMCSAAALMRSF
jgi:hypothetical protein